MSRSAAVRLPTEVDSRLRPNLEKRVLKNRVLENSVFVAGGLACGSGLIHVVAAVGHFHEYALFAVFFAVLAAVQFAWAAGVYRHPSRTLLRIGAVGSLLVAAVWIVSRTSGLPLGPERWEPESVGGFDSISTADEIVLALLVFAPADLRAGTVARWLSKEGVLAVGLLLILLSSLAVVSGGHAH